MEMTMKNRKVNYVSCSYCAMWNALKKGRMCKISSELKYTGKKYPQEKVKFLLQHEGDGETHSRDQEYIKCLR